MDAFFIWNQCCQLGSYCIVSGYVMTGLRRKKIEILVQYLWKVNQISQFLYNFLFCGNLIKTSSWQHCLPSLKWEEESSFPLFLLGKSQGSSSSSSFWGFVTVWIFLCFFRYVPWKKKEILAYTNNTTKGKKVLTALKFNKLGFPPSNLQPEDC